MNRGTFVGLAAGAALNAAGVKPAISIQDVEIRRPDIEMPAYYAQPRDASVDTPGVVVIMHAWGVDESIREVVRALAQSGFAAIAPNLFARLDAPSGDGVTDFSKFRPFVQDLTQSPDRVDADVRAAALWLKAAHPLGKVGVTGFCMGGAIALRQAVTNDDVFSADAVWYGNPADIDPAKIHIPLLGSYGERDTGIPADNVRAFRKALRAPNDIDIYPTAGHAFFDDHRASYVPAAAQDAWRRTVAFFTKYLKT